MDNTKLVEYADAKNKISQLVGGRDVTQVETTRTESQISETYNEQIKQLENDRDAKVRVITKQRQADVSQINIEIDHLHNSLQSINRQVAFLKEMESIEYKTVEVDKALIKPAQDTPIVWLDDLYKDAYLHIVLFIAENRRPKNKYSLGVRGNCSLLSVMPEKYLHGYDDLLAGHEPHHIRADIKQSPTIEELQVWVSKHWDSILSVFLLEYREAKTAYLDTILNYTLSDFETILAIHQVTEEQAPIICKITEYDKTVTLRLHNGFYYQQTDKEDGDPFDFIKVSGVCYKALCPPTLMQITKTGNTLFGNWYSISIEPHNSYHCYDGIFNKTNYELTIKEVTQRLKEQLKERFAQLSFTYPKVKWVHPELLES